MRLNDGTRAGIHLQRTKPPYLRCTKCDHVDYTQRWFEIDWRCPSQSGCDGGEADTVVADVVELRAHRRQRAGQALQDQG